MRIASIYRNPCSQWNPTSTSFLWAGTIARTGTIERFFFSQRSLIAVMNVPHFRRRNSHKNLTLVKFPMHADSSLKLSRGSMPLKPPSLRISFEPLVRSTPAPAGPIAGLESRRSCRLGVSHITSLICQREDFPRFVPSLSNESTLYEPLNLNKKPTHTARSPSSAFSSECNVKVSCEMPWRASRRQPLLLTSVRLHVGLERPWFVSS